jgi:hypothetical protein
MLLGHRDVGGSAFHLAERSADGPACERTLAGLEDTLYWRRAHSVGDVAQEADLLGFALGLNALTQHRHRKRRPASAAA